MRKIFSFFFKKKKVVLIQKRIILTIVLAVFIIEGLLFLKILQIIPYQNFLASIMPDLLIDLANQERSLFDLRRLTINPALEEAASLKARDMAQKGYFAHTSPEGITPWHWFEKAGYSFSYAGENLAVNFIDSGVLHRAWLNSAKHRDNILNENFIEIGIGTAEGVYKDRNAIFVVQLFGRPRLPVSLGQESSALPESVLTSQEEEGLKETEPASSVLILGEEKELASAQLQVIEEKDSFIAVKSLTDKEKDYGLLLAAEQTEVQYSTLMARALSAPKESINFLLMSLAAFLVFSGAFRLFKKPRMSIFSLAANGVIIFLIIGSSIYLNHWLFSLFGFIV